MQAQKTDRKIKAKATSIKFALEWLGVEANAGNNIDYEDVHEWWKIIIMTYVE